MADFPAYDLARNLTLASGAVSDPVINIVGGRYIVQSNAACIVQYLNADDATWTDATTLVASVPQTLAVGQFASLRVKATANVTLNCYLSGTVSNG